MSKDRWAYENLEVYVWEGQSDIADRVLRFLAPLGAEVIRASALDAPAQGARLKPCVAVISVSVVGATKSTALDFEALHGMPVIWVAAPVRETDPGRFPAEYAHILPHDFTGADLRNHIGKLLPQMMAGDAPRTDVELVAASQAMQQLLDQVDTFADFGSNVMLYGETGSGKERIARLFHDRNKHYGKGPFVPVNCGAIPDGLFESHFFGHAKGAFTGAMYAHRGYFEQANGGTLFLDEIADLPLHQQVKLLRVLEESLVTRLGSTQPVKVDFRLVAATHKGLREAVGEGRFRADLFFRMAVIELRLPSLDERGPSDKVALLAATLRQMLGEPGFEALPPMPEWLKGAVGFAHFAGNVRELRNLAERIAIVARQDGDWNEDRIRPLFRTLRPGSMELGTRPVERVDSEERIRIVAALDANGWRRQDTAACLGISRKVLWEKMRKFQIADGESEPA